MECQIYTAKLQRPPRPTSLQRWYIFGLILSKHVYNFQLGEIYEKPGEMAGDDL